MVSKTLWKYMLLNFWLLFLLILMTFMFLVVAGDVVDRLDDFLNFRIPITDIIVYYGYMLPPVIVFLIPISVLLSILRLLRAMSTSNAYTALIMGGVPLYVIVMPLVVSAILISAVTFFLGNRIAPHSDFKKKVMQKEKFKIHRPIERGISITGEDGLTYYISEYHKMDRQMKDLMITTQSVEGQIQRRVFADRVTWREQHWEGEGVTVQPYDGRGIPLRSEFFPRMKFNKLVAPEEILLSRKEPRYMGAAELKELSRQIPEDKVKIRNQLLLDYYRKYSLPSLPLIILVIAIPFGISTLRDTSSKSIGVGVLLSLAYYLVDAAFYQAGRGLWLSPMMAAWGTNFLFACFGGWLLYRTPR